MGGVAISDMGAASATVSRTIPGLRKAHLAVPRKPVRSVQVARTARFAGDLTQRALRRTIVALALPLVPKAQHGWHALLHPVVAYSVVFLGLAIVHIPFVIRAGARTFTDAAGIFWGDLVSGHLGHLLLYGALIALMSYAEGLFDEATASLYEFSLIAVKVIFWASLVVGVGLRLCGNAINGVTVLILGVVMGAELLGIGVLSRGSRAWGAGDAKRAKNVLIVGTTATAARVANQLRWGRNSGRAVKGIISRDRRGAPDVVGTVDELARIARAEFVDEIIVASGHDRDLGERAIAEAVRNHLDVSIVPDLLMDCASPVCVQTFGGMPLISVHLEPIPWFELLLKRMMDMTLSATALLLLLPCLLIIAAAIKLESHGPVLYTALRVGKKGHTFKCYKFRTMCPDAERAKDQLRALNQRQGPTFKIVNDPRITGVGRILRRYSLDELPQLWNVLNGTMSLVGPRPHPIDDYQRYALEDRRRLDVAPGITGLWQVTSRGDPSFSKNMALDLEYIENWSLRMDIGIVLRTLPAVLAGTGA